ncbi:MAG TPA: N-acetylmuramic acid 6-phosphate etherase [Tepidisphaeraceae bacterium]|jgi:N-acetylmuramic acid 6-phosphate etherase|nr:N-acetylmuramic acid 6-phosphate etherase [Tepidisphaeraceae bacterium]
MNDRSHLLTEQRLADSMNLDAMNVADAVALMNRQDQIAIDAVTAERANVARAIDLVVAALSRGGRLIYVGAGTSGRLGVLDASECPPTFRTDPETVQAIIAGGEAAVFRSQEGAEDNAAAGADAVDAKDVGPNDVVFGIAAGGTTPYVHGALRQATQRGARTVFLCCVADVPNEPPVDVVIRPLTGPEVVTGSTRLKAGTATKLVLNTVTTLAMVQLGKVYGNLMVDLRCSNDKLWERGARIVAAVTNLDRDAALTVLRAANGWVKAAIVMHERDVNEKEATRLLHAADGSLRVALLPSPGGPGGSKKA